MIDRYNRTIDYLRISVTDRCNLRCVYCMPEDGCPSLLAHDEILTYEEITRICRAGVKLGIKKIKLTGGEPLVRKDLPMLIKMLKQIEGMEQVTLTTNGVLLGEQLDDLVAAGLDAVNISLDTLEPLAYHEVTRIGALEPVKESVLKAAAISNRLPVKINCVPVLSDAKNIVEMAGLAKIYPIHVRFIEMMPIGLGRKFEFLSEDDIVSILSEAYGSLTPFEKALGNGPGHYYSIPGFKGKIGFISAVSHKFCDRCNRVRLTADGFLKTCLQYEYGNSLKDILRSGCTDQELEKKIKETIFDKPVGHHFQDKASQEKDEQLSMFQIGG